MIQYVLQYIHFVLDRRSPFISLNIIASSNQMACSSLSLCPLQPPHSRFILHWWSDKSPGCYSSIFLFTYDTSGQGNYSNGSELRKHFRYRFLHRSRKYRDASVYCCPLISAIESFCLS